MQLSKTASAAQNSDPLYAAAAKLKEAEALRQSKKLQRARQLCEQLLTQFPDYVGALHTLGLVMADMERYEESASYLSKAAMLCPKDWRILTALSTVNLKLKRADAAIANLEQAKNLKPDDPNIIGTLAEVYRNQKEYELAAGQFERFVAQEPELNHAKFALADCYEHLGNLEGAVSLYETLIRNGQSLAGAVAGLAQMPPSLASVDMLPLLQELEDSPDIDGEKVLYARALGLHRDGKYEEAWEQLVAANEPKKHLMAEDWRKTLSRRKAILEFARSVPVFEATAAPPKDHPVSLFIFGPSRAGKTTLERLLSSLRGVKRGYENPIVENAVRRTMQVSGCITRTGINGMPPGFDPDFATFYLEELRERAGDALVFTNTHPAKIIEVLRYARAIPGARFLFIKRDQNDLIIRTYMKNYKEGNYYAYDVRTIKENMDWYYSLIDVYIEKLPGISHLTNYEDMVSDPAAALDVAAKLCGIDGMPESRPQNYWNLVNDAILCDVAVERQVEVTGKDAAAFAQLLSPRDLSRMEVGQCKYLLLTNAEGGILNDPVLLRLGENHFWFSLADSDVLFWAQGVAVHAGLDVAIREPDVSPLQLQGPKSGHVMQALFGQWIADLRYFRFREIELDGIPLVVSRTGWSSELGYEIFLRDGTRGDELWERIMAAGTPYGLAPGHTSSIRRIEGAMLSYHADMDIGTNPYELGLDRLVDLDMDAEFIGKEALRRIRAEGVSRKQVGLRIEGEPLPGPNTSFWPLRKDGETLGKVTSAVHSPRLKDNIALAMTAVKHAALGTELQVQTPTETRAAKIVEKPFIDPKKTIATGARPA